mmetsp:Transcript_118609/g.185182  ORF Transcript_118609/g.185182 Transcript_118609/m.185182 type:complete len:83 (+) Transcript_118609:12-260(+)
MATEYVKDSIKPIRIFVARRKQHWSLLRCCNAGLLQLSASLRRVGGESSELNGLCHRDSGIRRRGSWTYHKAMDQVIYGTVW